MTDHKNNDPDVEDVEVVEGSNFEISAPVWVVLVLIVGIMILWGYLRWGESVFERIVVTFVILLILIAGASSRTWRTILSYFMFYLVAGSGWVFIINKLIIAIVAGNNKGLITWPAVFFCLTLFTGILPGIKSKNWVSPFYLLVTTSIFSALSNSLEVWLNSVAITFIVLSLTMLLKKRVANAEKNAEKSAISALLLITTIGVTGFVVLSTPIIVGAVLNNWWEIFSMTGGIFASFWLSWVLLNQIINRRVKRLPSKKANE